MTPGNVSNGSFVNTDQLAVTPLFGNVTDFYVIRHANYSSLASTDYRITLPTSQGSIDMPQLSSALTLNGRDSKIHVTDYDLGCSVSLLYSTADIFTWKKYGSSTILILYSGLNETNEIAFAGATTYKMHDGSGVQSQTRNGSLILNWVATAEQKVVQVGNNLEVYLLGMFRTTNNIQHVVFQCSRLSLRIDRGLMRVLMVQSSSLAHFLTGNVN